MTMWQKRRMGAGVAALLLGTLVIVACSDEDITGPSDLKDATWRLQSLELAGSPAFTPPDRSRFTVRFLDDGRVEAVTDCNQCGGTYTVSGNNLTVPEMTCTLVACGTGFGTQFESLLEGSGEFDRDGDELTIVSAEGRLRLSR
jgi:heat shock protein HslJ